MVMVVDNEVLPEKNLFQLQHLGLPNHVLTAIHHQRYQEVLKVLIQQKLEHETMLETIIYLKAFALELHVTHQNVNMVSLSSY